MSRCISVWAQTGCSWFSPFPLCREIGMLTLKLCRRLGFTILVALSFLFSIGLKDPAAFAQVAIAQPGTEGLDVIVNSTSPVIATYQGHSATYSDDLYLVVDDNPAHDKLLFNNRMSP